MNSSTVNWETNNYLVPNISRSKGNQAMKLGKLIECNMRNIVLQK